MMKKGMLAFGLLAMSVIGGSTCQASIIAPYGPGQIGYTAVVLCESLSLRQAPGVDSEVVQTMHYGDRVMVMTQENGWAQCAISDDVNGGPEGWMNTEYMAIDPSWYKTDSVTTVYAWNDTAALKVAELDKDTILPILKDDGDWLVVSLRGASGWIYKNDADKAGAVSGFAAEQTAGTTADQGSSTTAGQTAGTSTDQGSSTSQSEWTGKDFGEGAGLEDNWADLGYGSDTTTQSEWTGKDFGEGAGLEDNWADLGYSSDTTTQSEWTGKDFGEGAGLEDNWADAN